MLNDKKKGTYVCRYVYVCICIYRKQCENKTGNCETARSHQTLYACRDKQRVPGVGMTCHEGS